MKPVSAISQYTCEVKNSKVVFYIISKMRIFRFESFMVRMRSKVTPNTLPSRSSTVPAVLTSRSPEAAILSV